MLSASPQSHYNPALFPLYLFIYKQILIKQSLPASLPHDLFFSWALIATVGATSCFGLQTFGAHSGPRLPERPGSAGTWDQAIYGAGGVCGGAEGTARLALQAQPGVIMSEYAGPGWSDRTEGKVQVRGRMGVLREGLQTNGGPCPGDQLLD